MVGISKRIDRGNNSPLETTVDSARQEQLSMRTPNKELAARAVNQLAPKFPNVVIFAWADTRPPHQLNIRIEGPAAERFKAKQAVLRLVAEHEVASDVAQTPQSLWSRWSK